jgi:hypothetical protein
MTQFTLLISEAAEWLIPWLDSVLRVAEIVWKINGIAEGVHKFSKSVVAT